MFFLILCSLVVYTRGRLMFESLVVITLLGEEGACFCASRTFVCLFCACIFLSFFSSSCCRGLAVVCDCGIPWTFLLTFVFTCVRNHKNQNCLLVTHPNIRPAFNSASVYYNYNRTYITLLITLMSKMNYNRSTALERSGWEA